MNFYIIFHAIIGASMVICRPVDVNNDDRPLINYISPNEIDYLVTKIHEFNSIIFNQIITNFLTCFILADCGERARSQFGIRRFAIKRNIIVWSEPAKSGWSLENRCKSHQQTQTLFFGEKTVNPKKMLIGLPWMYHHTWWGYSKYIHIYWIIITENVNIHNLFKWEIWWWRNRQVMILLCQKTTTLTDSLWKCRLRRSLITSKKRRNTGTMAIDPLIVHWSADWKSFQCLWTKSSR